MAENAKETMNGRRSKDEIQGHIEATQEELRQTLEAIGESISPGEMLDTALHAMRVGPGEFATNLGRSVRDNPVAIGLVGAGLAWLMLGTGTRRDIRQRAGETGHRIRERAEKTGHQIVETAGKARSKVEGAAGDVESGAGDVADASREKAEDVRAGAKRSYDRMRGFASDQPLALAAVGLLAGAAAAAFLPRSRFEERAFGERAEHVTEVAEDAARGVSEGVREGLEGQGPAEGAASSDGSDSPIGEP